MAALLLDWTGLLQARNSPGTRPMQTASASPAAQEDPGSQGENGEDASSDEDKNVSQPDENGNEENGEAGEGGGGRGDGMGNGMGGGTGNGMGGGNRSSAKKVSYKDRVANAAKYTAQKQYARAIKEYNKALTALSEDDSRKVFVYERQGWLALMGNDIPGAESFYLAAIYQAEKIETFDKSAVNAYRGAAYCYEKDGDISSAVENYQLALKHASDKAAKADIRKKLQRLQAGKRKKAK